MATSQFKVSPVPASSGAGLELRNEIKRPEGKKLNDTHLEKGAITVQTAKSETQLPSPQGCI